MCVCVCVYVCVMCKADREEETADDQTYGLICFPWMV